MNVVQRDIASLREFQESAPEIAARVAERLQEDLDDLKTAVLAARPNGNGHRPRGLTERDFWIACGFLAAGVTVAKLFPFVQRLVE